MTAARRGGQTAATSGWGGPASEWRGPGTSQDGHAWSLRPSQPKAPASFSPRGHRYGQSLSPLAVT